MPCHAKRLTFDLIELTSPHVLFSTIPIAAHHAKIREVSPSRSRDTLLFRVASVPEIYLYHVYPGFQISLRVTSFVGSMLVVAHKTFTSLPPGGGQLKA